MGSIVQLPPSRLSPVKGIDFSRRESRCLSGKAPLGSQIRSWILLGKCMKQDSFRLIELVNQLFFKAVGGELHTPPTSSKHTPLVSSCRGVCRNRRSRIQSISVAFEHFRSVYFVRGMSVYRVDGTSKVYPGIDYI